MVSGAKRPAWEDAPNAQAGDGHAAGGEPSATTRIVSAVSEGIQPTAAARSAGYRTPASVYVASARPFPARLPEPEYPAHSYPCKVHERGQMSWRNRDVFISKVPGGEYVGPAPAKEGLCEVYYGPLLLGWLHQAEGYSAPGGRWGGIQEKTKQRATPMNRRPGPSPFPAMLRTGREAVKGSLRRAKTRRALDNLRPARGAHLIEGKGGIHDKGL